MDIKVKGVILLGCDVEELPVEEILEAGFRILYILRTAERELMICTEDLERDIRNDLIKLGIYVLEEDIFEQDIIMDKIDENLH
jgi:hypothetical protein